MPSFFLFDLFWGLGQNSKNNFIRFLVQMRTRKFATEMYWPKQDFLYLFCLQDDNDWGTSDWGDNSLSTKSIDTEDEKKKQREEKRLQRQKEIEAKRAAKKGPMKLGAKKQTQADPDLF